MGCQFRQLRAAVEIPLLRNLSAHEPALHLHGGLAARACALLPARRHACGGRLVPAGRAGARIFEAVLLELSAARARCGKIAAPKIVIVDGPTGLIFLRPKLTSSRVKLNPRTCYSLSTLSAHATSATKSGGVTKRAFFPSMSDWATARASEQAVHMWRGILCCMVLGIVSDSGGQPTGTTAFITASFIKDTASPSKKIWTSWPASANAFAWRNAKAAFVGSSEPQALLTRIFIRVTPMFLQR